MQQQGWVFVEELGLVGDQVNNWENYINAPRNDHIILIKDFDELI